MEGGVTVAKELENYCCPKCGSDFIDEFDCKDSEINLENDTIYLRQAMTCRDCGEDFTLVTTGNIVNLKFQAY
jgi:Zn finger protein HypA/HybF involved in hydrogenase expression